MENRYCTTEKMEEAFGKQKQERKNLKWILISRYISHSECLFSQFPATSHTRTNSRFSVFFFFDFDIGIFFKKSFLSFGF